VDRVDALDVGLGERVDLRARIARDHSQLAVEEDCCSSGKLVDDRRGGVRRHVGGPGVRVAPGDDRVCNLDRLDRVQALGGGSREHVRHPRSRPHRDRRGQATFGERIVERELLERDMEESAEIGVVRAFVEARTHHVHVEAMTRRVHHGIDSTDGSGESIGSGRHASLLPEHRP
jgi:hypothetical protein